MLSSAIRTPPIYRRKAAALSSTSVPVRCEQSTNEQGSGLDVWLGRLAMVGFAAAISVEVATGKGLLEVYYITMPISMPVIFFRFSIPSWMMIYYLCIMPYCISQPHLFWFIRKMVQPYIPLGFG